MGNLQRALLRAIQDQLQGALDDESAAVELVSSATLATSVATRTNSGPGTYVVTLTVGLPMAQVGRVSGTGRRRALAPAADAISAALNGLPQSGYFLQRLHEMGFDADALASSGALELSGGLVAPPIAADAPSAAAASAAVLTPASSLGIAVGAFALLLISIYAVYQWCAWERRIAQQSRGDFVAPARPPTIALGGVVLHMKEPVASRGVAPSPIPLTPADVHETAFDGCEPPLPPISLPFNPLFRLSRIQPRAPLTNLNSAQPSHFAPDSSWSTGSSTFASPASSALASPLAQPPHVSQTFGASPPHSAPVPPPSRSPRSLSSRWRGSPAQELYVANFYALLLAGNERGVAGLLARAPGLANAARDGLTPLHAAVRAKSLPLAQLLVRAGADIGALDRECRTAAAAAAAVGASGMAAWLEGAAAAAARGDGAP